MEINNYYFRIFPNDVGVPFEPLGFTVAETGLEMGLETGLVEIGLEIGMEMGLEIGLEVTLRRWFSSMISWMCCLMQFK